MKVREGVLSYKQTAYAILLQDAEVTTGHEKQVAMVRMEITNTDLTEIRRGTLWAFVPVEIDYPHNVGWYGPFGNYSIYEGLKALPSVPTGTLPTEDDVLRDGAVTLGIFEPGPGDLRLTVGRHGHAIRQSNEV